MGRWRGQAVSYLGSYGIFWSHPGKSRPTRGMGPKRVYVFKASLAFFAGDPGLKTPEIENYKLSATNSYLPLGPKAP